MVASKRDRWYLSVGHAIVSTFQHTVNRSVATILPQLRHANDRAMKSALDDRVAVAFPILRTIEWALPRASEELLFNALGARTRLTYLSPQWFDELNWITADEQVFEWIAIVESIVAAGDRYVMADLGAGYGRWLVNAALIARRLGRLPFVIGVEAEDTHFVWMKEHLADNEISAAEQALHHAPITGQRQDVPFTMGHPNDWYGQAVLPNPKSGFGYWPHAHVEMRRSVVLEDIIGQIPIVDLLDLDIQGMEAEVISSSIDLITERVKRIHIGTHSSEIEDAIRQLMAAKGWRPHFDFPCGTHGYPTAMGAIDFGDGVQDWLNPELS